MAVQNFRIKITFSDNFNKFRLDTKFTKNLERKT